MKKVGYLFILMAGLLAFNLNSAYGATKALYLAVDDGSGATIFKKVYLKRSILSKITSYNTFSCLYKDEAAQITYTFTMGSSCGEPVMMRLEIEQPYGDELYSSWSDLNYGSHKSTFGSVGSKNLNMSVMSGTMYRRFGLSLPGATNPVQVEKIEILPSASGFNPNKKLSCMMNYFDYQCAESE